MDAADLIHKYKAEYQPGHSYRRNENWMERLGKVDLTILILGSLLLVASMLLLIKKEN